jgi:hypothetical protein
VVILALVVSLLGLTHKTAEAGAGLDLNLYCQTKGHDYATLVSNDAYGWRCADNDGSLYDMDLNQACRVQYAGDWSARYRDFNDAYSWECQHWCNVQPNASQFGWQGANPNFALRVDGPSSMDWDPGSGKEYYIYYQGYFIGPDVIGPHGYSDGHMEWGVDTTWTISHPDWRTDANWQIHYTVSDNSCSFSKH